MKPDLKKLQADYEQALRNGDIERAGELASEIMDLEDQAPEQQKKRTKHADADKE
jgi:hypothetical protein